MIGENNMENETPNFICFFNPYSRIPGNINIINQTLATPDYIKQSINSMLISADAYNSILEFHSSGCMVVLSGSKINDKRDVLMKQLEHLFGDFNRR
jgi:hypothetical protein